MALLVKFIFNICNPNFVLVLQKDDLKAVVNYLREDGNVSLIGLWGRSMGAVTRSICCFIL